VAGIDVNSSKWVRLYPVQFRDLAEEKRFAKYSIIEAQTKKSPDDHRPESLHINSDSISVIERLDTKNGWQRRKSIVLPTLSESFCAILKQQQDKGLSLGAFRPGVTDFTWEKASLKDEDKRKACYAQTSFLNATKTALEPLPYNFRYTFRCATEPRCPGHDLMIIDWELSTAFYKWRTQYPDVLTRLSKIKQRWLGDLCSERNDTVFFVGNVKRFRETFMTLGVLYPPRQ
jgi:hypothetical protein